MQTLDADGTVELIEAARGTRYGRRRSCLASSAGCAGARSWPCAGARSIWSAGQLAVVASTEQTDEGIREKETKSGKSRAVALPAMIMESFVSTGSGRRSGLLQLGVRLDDDHHVVAREDGQPLQPRSLTHAFVKFIHGMACNEDSAP